MGFPLILFFGTNDVWWANVLWTIVIVSCIVCAIGARFFRWLYHRQFLAIGPNGVLFRKLGTATFFRWSDLASIEQVWVEWEHHKPDTLDEDIPSHFKDQIQCTFHSGNTIMLSNTRDTRLNRDEVKSFEMFMALVLAYWKRANRTSFRGAEISMAEVEALMELEQVTGQTFKSMETPQSDTALSFTAAGGHVRGVIMVQCGLETLPESIGQLSHLVELHLDHNLIQTLPATIGYLSSLAELHLQNNPITALPESIGQLQSLRRLYLNEGVISALSGAGELWVEYLLKRGCLNPP